MDTKSVGEISEAMFIARFLQLRWTVLKPFGDNKRFDLVIDRGYGFERVQVKTARYKNGTVMFNAYTVSTSNKNLGYHGQCDLFAVYCTSLDRFYLLKVEDFKATRIHLRVVPPKNEQVRHVKYAKEYEI